MQLTVLQDCFNCSDNYETNTSVSDPSEADKTVSERKYPNLSYNFVIIYTFNVYLFCIYSCFMGIGAILNKLVVLLAFVTLICL